MKRLYGLLLVGGMLNAQQQDSLSIKKGEYRFQYRQLAAPIALMATGVGIATSEKRNFEVKENQNFLAVGNYWEDYGQLAPHAAVYAFDWAGMQPKTDFWNRSAIMVKGEIIALASVTGFKYLFQKPRPDGSNQYGFPSGHTTNAFAGATMLAVEYGSRYRWVPYVAYGTATAVGISRVVHQKHTWSDVIFGAGLGILSMKIAYWTHQYRWNKKEENLSSMDAILMKK